MLKLQLQSERFLLIVEHPLALVKLPPAAEECFNNLAPAAGAPGEGPESTRLSRSRRVLRTTGVGHEERFPLPRLSGRCRFQKRSADVDDWANVGFWVRLLRPRCESCAQWTIVLRAATKSNISKR